MTSLDPIPPQKQILPATVFVIDDDSIVLRRVTKESLRQTNLGILTAEDLPTAVKLFDQNFPIGAILADLHFRPETQDADRSLHNGLDFLAYVKKTRPELPVYVMSMDSEDRQSRTQASALGLRVRDWYDKLNYENQFSPWVRIERDLILQALKAEPAFRERATASGETTADLLADEDVAEKVRNIFNYPRLTYMQYLPRGAGFMLKQPIAVHCWPHGKGFRAMATKIPLLVEAEGDDAVEALDNLGLLLASEKQQLDAEDESHIVGYARYIKDQLDSYLEQATDDLA